MVEAFIRDAKLDDPAFKDHLQWDEQLGFMRYAKEDDDPEFITAVGYCNALPAKKMLPQIIIPRTCYNQLEDEEQNIDLQGKGIGPRLYNHALAITGLKEYSSVVGLYSVQLERARIADTRKTTDTSMLRKLGRIGQHASLMTYSAAKGVEAAIDRVHAQFPEDMHALLYSQPPNAERREQSVNGVTSEFMIIRDATKLLTKRGEVWIG